MALNTGIRAWRDESARSSSTMRALAQVVCAFLKSPSIIIHVGLDWRPTVTIMATFTGPPETRRTKLVGRDEVGQDGLPVKSEEGSNREAGQDKADCDGTVTEKAGDSADFRGIFVESH